MFVIGNMNSNDLDGIITNEILSRHNVYGVTFNGEIHNGMRLFNAEDMYWEPSSETIAGRDDFRNIAPFNVKKCITQYNTDTNKREVLAYEGDSNYDDAVLDNAGDHMIEFPMFYFSRPDTYTFLVSPDPIDGFIPSPMHTKGNTIYDKVRISEYFLNSGSPMSCPGTIADSIRLSNIDMQGFRDRLRSKDLYILDYDSYFMICILAIIKYASLNVKKSVGLGYCYEGFYWNYDPSTITLGDSIKGLDGYQVYNDRGHTRVMGLSDLYGLVFNVMEGVFIYNWNLYVNKDIKNITGFPSTPTDWEMVSDIMLTATNSTDDNFDYSINNISYSPSYPSIMTPTSFSSLSEAKDNPIGDGIYSNVAYDGGSMSLVLMGGPMVMLDYYIPYYSGLFSFFASDFLLTNTSSTWMNAAFRFQEF